MGSVPYIPVWLFPNRYNSGDETLAHVCESSTSHNLLYMIYVYEINYIIFKTIGDEKKKNNNSRIMINYCNYRKNVRTRRNRIACKHDVYDDVITCTCRNKL